MNPKPEMTAYKHHVFVCAGQKCCANNAGEILFKQLKEKLKDLGLDQGETRIHRSGSGCLGTCQSGPLLCVYPEGLWYYAVTEEKLDIIIQQHLVEGKPVTEWLYHQH